MAEAVPIRPELDRAQIELRQYQDDLRRKDNLRRFDERKAKVSAPKSDVQRDAAIFVAGMYAGAMASVLLAWLS